MADQYAQVSQAEVKTEENSVEYGYSTQEQYAYTAAYPYFQPYYQPCFPYYEFSYPPPPLWYDMGGAAPNHNVAPISYETHGYTDVTETRLSALEQRLNKLEEDRLKELEEYVDRVLGRRVLYQPTN